MSRSAIVAGTGHQNSDGSNRQQLIQKHCKEGMQALLAREPSNEHDSNAVAVYLETKGIFGFGKKKMQIGYIKARTAKSISKRLDNGEQVKAKVKSFWAPEGREHPRVTLELDI